MPDDSANQPQPDPQDHKRRTGAEQGEPSILAPDELRNVKAGERPPAKPKPSRD
jgi:hypothetical protein